MTLLTTLLAGALVLAPQQQTDTTFAVPAGGRLAVEAVNATVVVRSWDRDAVRVRTTRSGDSRVVIQQRGGRVSVVAQTTGTPEAAVAFDIMVPRSFGVDVEGLRMRTTIEGVRGSIDISNAEGDVTVRESTGDVAIESIGGAITLAAVRGNVAVSTANHAITLTDVRGDVSASTVNGSITMRAIDSHRVEASTVNGAVEYSGTVHDRGRYYLGAHNGEITMGVPASANAAVSVSTRMGQVNAAFPVPAGSLRDGRLSFALGTGSATIELQSFNGAVKLVRPRSVQR